MRAPNAGRANASSRRCSQECWRHEIAHQRPHFEEISRLRSDALLK
jgi:hypothetical protein